MIFQSRIAAAQKSGVFVQPETQSRLIQRKCACGGTPGPTGECEECRRKRVGLQTKLTINQPGDRYEQEADRVAEAVLSGASSSRPFISSLGKTNKAQRDGPPKEEPKFNAEYKEKTEEEKYKEAAKKVGEAFLKTPPGKEIEEKAKELGDAFISTLPGKVITGAAVAGAVATLAATHKELPIGIPEIPLDRIKPGLKMKITYEGPVDKPTKVMATFSFSFGAAGKKGETKPKLTESEKRARKAAELRSELRTSEEKAAEARIVASRMLRPDQLTPRTSPLSFGVAGEQLGFKPGVPPAAARSPLSPWAPDLKLTGETTEEPKKKEEETLQRKSAGYDQVSHAPAIVDEVLQSSGEPLDRSTRAFMEQRFGYDFGAVRIHSDACAADSARAVDARAFTVGRDIVFATGQFAPESPSGQRLLAHELAHVLQQREATTALGSDSDNTRVVPALQRKRPTQFDEPAGDPNYEGPRFTRRRSVCLEPGSFKVGSAVGPNDRNQARGYLDIAFRGRGRTRWVKGTQKYFGKGGWEKVGEKVCDCDCMLYRQFLRGIAFLRAQGASSYQKVSTITSGRTSVPADGQWHEEDPLEHSRRCGSEATWHGCNRQYCDEPGVTGSAGSNQEILLRYNFLLQVWDLCQEKTVKEEHRTLTVAGAAPPRIIGWDNSWLALNRNDISRYTISTPPTSSPVAPQTKAGTIQRKTEATPENEHVPPTVEEVLRSNGEPLDTATRDFFGPRFDYDFSRVRVHADGKAAASADALNALAYTAHQHIVFGDGQFSPETSRGRQLLAHELTHVIQQGNHSGSVSKHLSLAQGQSHPAETQADDIAHRITLGRPLGHWHPIPPSAFLSLAPQDWFRGEREGAAISKDAGPGSRGFVHDLGEGVYFTDSSDVAEEYGELRSPDLKTRRVIGGEVDPHKLGRVLDLTEDPDFMKSFKALKKTLPKPSGEPYRNLFEHFLKKKGLKLEDFDVIIGPEGVRDGKQMCIRNHKIAEKVKSAMKPVKRGGTGGTGGTGGEPGGGDGESGPARSRRRRSPAKGAAGVEPPAGETETPSPKGSARRRGPGGFHVPEDSHPLTVRRSGRDIALGMGAGLALGILQGEMRRKIEQDLAKLPKPKIDKRSAEEFLADPDSGASAKLIDLFNKQLKPFRGELSEFHSGLMEELNEELLGLAETKGKAKGTYQKKLAALKRLEKKLDTYREKLNTIDDNLGAILEKEKDALKAKESADKLRKLLEDGFIVDWLIHQGFDIDDIERMDINLSAISNSITKLFDEARKTKKLVESLKKEEDSMSQSLQETENQEFRGLFELYVEERRKKEAEMLRGRERPDSPLPEPEPSPYLNPDEKGAYFGLRSEESRLLLELKKLEESVSPNDIEALKQMHEWQRLKRQLDQVRKEKRKYEGTPA